MTQKRRQQLERNFSTMFLIQAFLNFKVMNVIFTLFYIHRGLSLSQVFYLSIIFSIVNVLFEIPSSYMADKWGRKKTIQFGILCGLVSWILLILAHDFVLFVTGMVFVSLQFSSFSGTDDALIYDTNKELGNHIGSLKRLSRYYSARNVAKIFTPLVAVFIAKDLVEWQFISVILIDVLAVLIALILSFRITEAHHYMDVEKMEAGVIRDAAKLIRSNPYMIRGIMGKTIVFIASFVVWRYFQEFLVSFLGLSVLVLGIAWALYNVAVFLWDRYVTEHFYTNLVYYINVANFSFFVLSIMLLGVAFIFPQPYLILVVMILLFFAERIRWSLYAQFFNHFSNSFNRATTISLSNLFKSIMDIPLLFIAAIMVRHNMNYPFILTIILATIVIIFFRLRPQKYDLQVS